jgi:hypothetical protein
MTFPDVIGLIGSAIFIAAFAYANVAEVLNKRLFNALNLVGAVLLLTSLYYHFNLAATVLEVAWGLIALAGLINTYRTPGQKPGGKRAEP